MRYVCMLSVALAASAVGSAPAHAAMFGGEVYGQFNTHTLGDWNDLIDEANNMGANFDNVTTSFSGGIGARMWASPNVMISAAWEPLFPSTEDQGTEVKLTANAILGTVAYFFPTAGNGKYGIGGGVGFYSLSGKITEPGNPDLELKGNTVGFHVLGLAEWIVSPGFGVTAGAGYRVANIGDTELDGMSSDPKTETDYSGFMGRAGLVFYLPSAD